MTPNVMVRKPENFRISFVTETNNTVNKTVNPTDSQPSTVCGDSKKRLGIFFILHLQRQPSTQRRGFQVTFIL